MAQKVIVETVDDLDGTVINDGTGGTVQFALQGRSYEIDLSDENTGRLQELLEPYISKARQTGQIRRPSTPSPKNSSKLQDIREWARANGHQVSERGRIAKTVQDAYASANG